MLDEFIPVFGNTLPSSLAAALASCFGPKLLPSPAGVFNVDKSNSGTSLTAGKLAANTFNSSNNSL